MFASQMVGCFKEPRLFGEVLPSFRSVRKITLKVQIIFLKTANSVFPPSYGSYKPIGIPFHFYLYSSDHLLQKLLIA